MLKFNDKIQLIIIGESSVGKTSILYKYTQGFFSTQHLATVGLEYFTKEEVIEDKVIRVKFWDTAGQEQYKSLTRNFYRNSDGVIIVYDVTNKNSFYKVQEWVESVYDNTDKSVSMILIGNKTDLPREVSKQEGERMAESFKIKYFETSAKENSGINESMMEIVSLVINNKKMIEKDTVEIQEVNNSSSGCKC